MHAAIVSAIAAATVTMATEATTVLIGCCSFTCYNQRRLHESMTSTVVNG